MKNPSIEKRRIGVDLNGDHAEPVLLGDQGFREAA